MSIQGPYFRKLVATYAAKLMVPKGAGIGEALESIRKPGNLLAVTRTAMNWCDMAILAVQAAPGGKAFGDKEAIAKHLLEEIEKREEQQRLERSKK
jgi:hypothetical protein